MNIYRLLTDKLYRQKRNHFRDKIKVIYKKIWDHEFLRLKQLEIREDLRVQYDRTKEQIDAANFRLEEEKKKTDADKTIVDNLDNFIKQRSPDLEQFVKQMKGIDEQIEGEEGINKAIEGYRNVLQMVISARKKI